MAGQGEQVQRYSKSSRGRFGKKKERASYTMQHAGAKYRRSLGKSSTPRIQSRGTTVDGTTQSGSMKRFMGVRKDYDTFGRFLQYGPAHQVMADYEAGKAIDEKMKKHYGGGSRGK